MKERRSVRRRARGARALIGTLPALPPQTHVTSTASTEVALHELGESLVTSAVTVQRELRRYGEANGAFMLEDLEMDLPVKLRVDSLGQMMAEVVNEPAANSVLTRIRLRIRPDSHPVDSIPIIADAPLARLQTLSSEQIAFLKLHRIFSVEDLLRAVRSVAVRNALEAVIPATALDDSLSRAGVLLIPVPARVAMALLDAGLKSADEFLRRDTLQLANLLTKSLGETVSKDFVTQWQGALGKLRALTPPGAEVVRPNETTPVVAPALSLPRQVLSI
jgi:hypothetical protein